MTTACSSFSSFINDENKLIRYYADKIATFEKNEKLIQDYTRKINRSEKGYEIIFIVIFFIINVSNKNLRSMKNIREIAKFNFTYPYPFL